MSTKRQRQDAHRAVTMLASGTGRDIITIATLQRALEHAEREGYLVIDKDYRRSDFSRARSITLTYRGCYVLGVEGARCRPADLVRKAPWLWADLLGTVPPVYNRYI